MPPLPVIADVYRCVLEWNQNLGVTPRNVFHVQSDSSTLPDIALGIGAAMSDDMFIAMPSAFGVSSVFITPLDGVTAGGSFPLGATFNSIESGQPMPAVAVVQTLTTEQRGPRGRGRMYIGPASEAVCDAGHFVGDAVGLMDTAWDNFIADLTTGDPTLVLVVASYVHADAHPVTSHRTNEVLGTVRRRQDQLR